MAAKSLFALNYDNTLPQEMIEVIEFRINELVEESRKVGKKVTQTMLAKAAQVSGPTISKIANGKVENPGFQIMQAIADEFSRALGREIRIDDLIERNGKPADKPLEFRESADITTVHEGDFVELPEFGRVPCGDLRQIPDAYIVERHLIPKAWAGKAQFMLRASGNSMYPEIRDGELLLIEPGHRFEDGDIVVALVDDEVTCKYLQIQTEHVLLVPENTQEHKTIVVNGSIEIIGRVVGSMRKYNRKRW